MKLTLLAIALAALLVIVLLRRMDKTNAAAREAAVTDVEASPVEEIASWPEENLRRTAHLVGTQRVILAAKKGEEGQSALTTDRITRELERVAAAEQKLVEADRASAGLLFGPRLTP
jgi:hypothetical protein